MTIGKVPPFNPSTDDFESWVDVLQSFFTANGIAQTSLEEKEKAVAIFLSTVGLQAFTVLKDLCAPTEPTKKTFTELITILKAHYKPAPQALAERFKFHTRKQRSGETVNTYVADLRRMAVTCQFEKLDISLRDQMIFGLQSEAAQKRLFLEDHAKLSLVQAVGIATSQEQADSSTQVVRGGATPTLSDTFKLSKYKNMKKQKGQFSNSSCTNCGGNHAPKDCPHKNSECHACHKRGHFAKFCRSSGKQSKQFPARKPVHAVHQVSRDRPIIVDVLINDRAHIMEMDTASGSSFISQDFWQRLGSPRLQKSQVGFKTYTGETFNSKGQLTCSVFHNGQTHPCILHVAAGSSLFGRDLLSKFQMDWSKIKSQCIHQIRSPAQKRLELEALLQEFNDVFDRPIGKIKDFKARITLKDDAVPKFFKARPVPYALREKVEAELDYMEQHGIITRVEHSEWASPLVVVPKSSGKIRITGDFKCTVNNQLCIKQYPLTKVDDLLEKIGSGQLFSKLDASDAFHQVEIEDSCKKFLVVNTHRGLYQYNVLPQGIASSPATFQELVDKMLQGIPMTGSFIDDIISTGRNDDEHLCNLRSILQRMRDSNYRLTRSKCVFWQDQVPFLGHIVCSEGLRTDPSKVEAIRDMPTPQDADDVKSFLGLVNFYSKFIPNLSEAADPLYRLTRQDVPWNWTPACSQSLSRIKQLVSSSEALAHYQQSIPVGISCDASSVGLGVVLYHTYPDGSERPIAYASKTLSSSERNYSQIEKEGLSIIFGVKKFFSFLFGTRFTLVTDHQPLLAIFGEKRDLPSLIATRLHRWALFLSGFQYDIVYRNTTKHGNADALSRLPLPGSGSIDEHAEIEVKAITSENPVSSELVRLRTSRDPLLSQVVRYTQEGWPKNKSTIEENLHPYFAHHAELWINKGIVMWGLRVVLPGSLTQDVLKQLHSTHPGIVKMKGLARQYVWWPGIDAAIEQAVHACTRCAEHRDNPAVAPLHPWAFPEKPWQRLHIDLAGPFLNNNMWLIIVDAHSKWPEVFKLGHDSTSGRVIKYIRECISRFGIPDTIVSDNGPQFISAEFAAFCKSNGIRHSKSSAYHPRSNGEAERFVRSFKNALKDTKHDTDLTLSNFLLTYRITPHSTTGVSPTELLLKKKPKTVLDLMRPDVATTTRSNQEKQQEQFNNKWTGRQFHPNEPVWVQTFSKSQPKWSMGTVIKAVGPVSYQVRVNDRIMKRHVDHIISAEVVLQTPGPVPDHPPAAEQEVVVTPPPTPEKFESAPGSPVIAQAPPLFVHPPQPTAPPAEELDDSLARNRVRRNAQPTQYYASADFRRKK
jgi:RNase H-like domain found in reverse transcriptase/Reverse transcriptase (RNA-dependent DNA polymerase)/Integrase zinc binding domain/Integrase core domain